MSDVDVLSWLDQTETIRPHITVNSTSSLITDSTVGTSFEISRDVLLYLLEKAITLVPSKNIIPVMNNFQFKVYKDRLEVIATSPINSIVLTTKQINTVRGGIEVFPARTLLTIIKECSSGSDVAIEVTSHSAVITSGGFSAEIQLPYGKDFPDMENLDEVEFYSVDRAAFTNAVSAVRYALPNRDFSGQSSMKVINIKNGKFTAWDGARLQQVRIDDFDLNMQLPSDSISALLKLLSVSEEKLFIGETLNKLIFKMSNFTIYLNKITSIYPNVDKIWLRPALNNDQQLLIDKAELITAIKQVKVASDSEFNTIALIINSDKIEIRAKDMNNTARAIISCQWSGKPKTVVVNFIFLAEMLKAYEPKECKFMLGEDIKGSKAPVLLKDDETMAIATIPQMMNYRMDLTND